MNLSAVFDKSQNLPNIPKIVQELIESFNNDDVDIDEISKKVAMDQVLTAKVLRLANSAHYGCARTIATTQDAVILLGFQTLRTLVLASGITGSFVYPKNLDRNQFWRDSFAVAAIAKWLARYTKDNPETAFTCGMLHNIGGLMMYIALPDEACSIEKSVQLGGVKHELEQNQLGFDYSVVGAELAKRWKFPEEIQLSIRHQCEPMAAEPFSRLAATIYIARYIHDAHNRNVSDDELVENFPVDVAKAMGMDMGRALADVADTLDLSSGIESLLD